MKKTYSFFLFFFIAFSVYAKDFEVTAPGDTSEIISLNKLAYSNRLTDPQQTISAASKALDMAKKINYNNGIGEAYRCMGIGMYYLDQYEKSFDLYLNAITYFTKANNLGGEAKVYNNIGNLFRDHDADRSIDYFSKSLAIATKLGDTRLIASLDLNLGNVYTRKNSLHQALKYYDQSNKLFEKLRDSVNLIQCLQNRGVIYYQLGQYDKAETLLLQANNAAKHQDMNESIASINLTLASLYINQKRFDDAEKTVKEGVTYAQLFKDPKLDYDYKHTTYELEYNRKNYERALYYLREIYKVDSTTYRSNTSVQMNLIETKRKQEEQIKENERVAERQAYDRSRFWAVTTVAGLLLIVIGLLVGNVKRKAKTNAQLTMLNGEVSRQKDNLDRINHHLEEIIDERTKDLQIKNKKLSEHSSYLSHQIRGPIATLRGLINLEKEGLVEQQECIDMMDKCVSEIDEKIIEMSDMLHNPSQDTIS
ncbi:tetratricopeptide repeat protein [Mucilaginibacter sp. SP1R1]|uniref:tetratricopeptide repeat protein n=1 Tax=Mucilaginibacter sp. SP1R1 TaxID=2723091 RepID=UPI00161EDA2D|nr:tetratricopeptide repeat protein [Mucilaginibacter sp. SP1R1]MBB6150621.1 tetratricopeptide (TPR) repeat protein [Mucilaginibacter sp. SP1R1]